MTFTKKVLSVKRTDLRKLVAAAICLLSLSLSVTTGRKCIKEARTRTGKKCCEQQLRRVDKALSRAEDIPEGSWICLSHRNLILAEDKRCSMFLQFLAHAQTFDRGVPCTWLVSMIGRPYGIQNSIKSRWNTLFPKAVRMIFSGNRAPVVSPPYFVPMETANCRTHLGPVYMDGGCPG